MRTLIAVLIGAIIATGAAAVLVHNATMTRQAPARVLYNHGSG
jgi:Tfp pilus assembly protein PilV